MIVSAPVLRTSVSVSESSLLDAAPVTRNTAALNNLNTLCYVEQKPDTFCTQENISGKENICVGGKEIISMISGGEEGVTGARGASEQETGVKQRISNNPEHFNSSEDEEISKELSSILTNRGAETTSVLRPRFLTNLRKYNPGASHYPILETSDSSDPAAEQITANDSLKISNLEKCNQISSSDVIKTVPKSCFPRLSGAAELNSSEESEINLTLTEQENISAAADCGKVSDEECRGGNTASNSIFTATTTHLSSLLSSAAVRGE